MKQTTLWFIIEDWKILLAMKKRGFWKGLYNGVGGKLEKLETIQQAMIREAEEEIWVKVNSLEYIWILNFYFDANPDWNQSVNVFFIKDYTWNIKETEEMKPYWFELEKIPYDSMWEDDKIWLPEVLSGARAIEYDFFFGLDWKLRNWEKIK